MAVVRPADPINLKGTNHNSWVSVLPMNDMGRMGDKRMLTSKERLYQPLRSFCEMTSMHGLGQIVQDHILILKSVWMILFFGAVVGNVYHISTLVQTYLTRPVQEVTSISAKTAPFPDVTICNIDQISTTNFRDLQASKNNTWVRYIELLEKLRAANEISQFDFIQMQSQTRLFENVARGDIAKMGHQLKDLVLQCKFMGAPCDMNGFTRIITGTQFNCYTFHGSQFSNDVDTTGGERGLSLVLYTEATNGTTPGVGLYNEYSNVGNALGVRVLVHPPGTLPPIHVEGFDVQPGHSTSVSLKSHHIHKLPDPYGDCVYNSTLQGDPDFRYSSGACLDLCQQQHNFNRCGCVTSFMAIPKDLADAPFCAGLAQNATDLNALMQDFYGRRDCLMASWLAFGSSEEMRSECGCHRPCDTYRYDVSISRSDWPSPKLYNQFLWDQILNNPDRHNLIAFDQLWGVVEQLQPDYEYGNGTEEPEIVIPEEAHKFLLMNFLRLNVYFRDQEVEVHTQEASYVLANVFSDMGGTLGLWVGLSILTVAEVMQLLAKLCAVLCGKK